MTQHAGLPVAGYQPQSDDKVQTVKRVADKYGITPTTVYNYIPGPEVRRLQGRKRRKR